MKLIKLPTVDSRQTIDSLKEKYQREGWKEKELIKYWILAHKIEGLASELVPMTYKVKAILRKFLKEIATDDLPDVIRFAVQYGDVLMWQIKSYNGTLISFCYNYGRIYRRYVAEE